MYTTRRSGFDRDDARLHHAQLNKRSDDDFVQIEYWVQLTAEHGHYTKTLPIKRSIAEQCVGGFDRGTVVELEGTR